MVEIVCESPEGKCKTVTREVYDTNLRDKGWRVLHVAETTATKQEAEASKTKTASKADADGG